MMMSSKSGVLKMPDPAPIVNKVLEKLPPNFVIPGLQAHLPVEPLKDIPTQMIVGLGGLKMDGLAPPTAVPFAAPPATFSQSPLPNDFAPATPSVPPPAPRP